MKTITYASTATRLITELELPRKNSFGEFPNIETIVTEDNPEERKKDFDYLCKTYKDCKVIQKDENGKIIRENNVNVDEIQRQNEACGF